MHCDWRVSEASHVSQIDGARSSSASHGMKIAVKGIGIMMKGRKKKEEQVVLDSLVCQSVLIPPTRRRRDEFLLSPGNLIGPWKFRGT